MGPRVVAELDLPRLHQRPQQLTVLRPRPIGAVDEIRQPHAGVLGELRVETHHVGVDTVVQRQRQQVAPAGNAAQRPAAGQRHPRRDHRWRRRRRLRDPRVGADGAAGKADAGKGCHGQARKEVPPVQLGPGVGDLFAASHRDYCLATRPKSPRFARVSQPFATYRTGGGPYRTGGGPIAQVGPYRTVSAAVLRWA